MCYSCPRSYSRVTSLGRDVRPLDLARAVSRLCPAAVGVDAVGTRLARLALAHPLADHVGHAVAAHAHAVQRVGDLHGALLVGDDDELAVLAQLLEDVEQPAEVDVVEGGLDLVEHVERARPGLEQRDEERHGGQRALATGQQRQPLDLLARRAGLDLDAGGEHVLRVGQHQPASTAGEQPGEHLLELHGHVGVGGGEHLLDPGVHVVDQVEQVLARALQVVELLGQEAVALLERGELLEGQRVDLAQQRHGLLRRPAAGAPARRGRTGTAPAPGRSGPRRRPGRAATAARAGRGRSRR